MTFAAPTTITLSTQNINGFKGSKDFLHSLCDKYPDSIRGIQEHWLSPAYKNIQGVNQLRALHPDFDGYGSSAMKKVHEQGIRVGRPYGRTGFLYNKKFSHCLRPLIEYESDRITVMELTEGEGNILIINVYFPYYDVSKLEQQMLLYRETVG